MIIVLILLHRYQNSLQYSSFLSILLYITNHNLRHLMLELLETVLRLLVGRKSWEQDQLQVKSQDLRIN